MNHVCSDILRLIFSKCTILEIILNRRVCKRWKNIVDTSCKYNFLPEVDWKDYNGYDPLSYIDEYIKVDDLKVSTTFASTNINLSKDEMYSMCREISKKQGNLYFYVVGEPEEQWWYLLGKIHNYYYLMIASCSYTGFEWGDISFTFSDSLIDIINLGMTDDARFQFIKF